MSRNRRAARVAAGLSASVLVASTVLASAGVTERVSVDSAGNQANAPSLTFVDVAAGGRFVVFASDASNLVPGDTNGLQDVFVRDRRTGTTERASVDSFGNQANGFNAPSPGISDDGRYVAFHSDASNLIPDDTNSNTDAFVHDRVSGATERVATEAGNNMVDISGDGRYVVFDSFAPLVPDDTNEGGDVFVHDRETGATERVSVDSAGNEADTGASYVVQSLYATISANGRHVEFVSNATNLVSGDTNATWDVFVHDRQTGATERISVDSDENQSHEPRVPPSSGPAIFSYLSADGRFAAFLSSASDLFAGDTDGQQDVFVRDRLAGTTELASVDTT
jgi:Tol biopolymer transport system component